MKKIKRFLPLTIILTFIVIAYSLGFTSYLTWDNFGHVYRSALEYVDAHPIASPLVFMGVYTLYAALSLPGISLLTVLGGGIFPQPLSTIYVLLSATIGASILFFSVKTAVGNFLHQRAGPMLHKMEKEFHHNEVSYLLFLRFMPVFPFWLVNIAPAFFGVSFFTFLWTTLIGIAPGSFVLTQFGAAIFNVVKSEEYFSLRSIFNFETNMALLGLACLSLIPILIKKNTKRKS